MARESDIYYAANEETELWSTTDPHDAVDEVLGDWSEEPLKDGDIISIYAGKVDYKDASFFMSDKFMTQFKDDLVENADDYMQPLGDCTETFMAGPCDGLRMVMCNALDKWCKKNDKEPDFGRMVNIKEVRVRVLSLEKTEWEFVEEESSDE